MAVHGNEAELEVARSVLPTASIHKSRIISDLLNFGKGLFTEGTRLSAWQCEAACGGGGSQ